MIKRLGRNKMGRISIGTTNVISFIFLTIFEYLIFLMLCKSLSLVFVKFLSFADRWLHCNVFQHTFQSVNLEKRLCLHLLCLSNRIKKYLYTCNENCMYTLVTIIMDCRYHTHQTLIFLVKFQMFKHYNVINQFYRRNIIIM